MCDEGEYGESSLRLMQDSLELFLLSRNDRLGASGRWLSESTSLVSFVNLNRKLSIPSPPKHGSVIVGSSRHGDPAYPPTPGRTRTLRSGKTASTNSLNGKSTDSHIIAIPIWVELLMWVRDFTAESTYHTRISIDWFSYKRAQSVIDLHQSQVTCLIGHGDPAPYVNVAVD